MNPSLAVVGSELRSVPFDKIDEYLANANLEELLADPDFVIANQVMVEEQASAARSDIVAFYEFVMREETTNAPLKAAPHQRVGLRFMVDHDRSVNLWPVGFAKTYAAVAVTLFKLGRDPTTRGAIVSATQAQASKVLQKVRDEIETNPRLHLVFPNLRKGTRRTDKWSDTAITVMRPPGIRDASLVAFGLEAERHGSRLSWVVCDDVLTLENTETKEAQDKLYDLFDKCVVSRLDPTDAQIIVTNVPFNDFDLLARLRSPTIGWPTIRFDALGDVEIENTDWDSNELRPANDGNHLCRLVANDPDPSNVVPLWPEHRGEKFIESVQRGRLPHVFNQLYRCITRDPKKAIVDVAWFENAKKLAREWKTEDGKGFQTLVAYYRGPNPTVTGVDLSTGEAKDDTCLFTIELLPGGFRRILDIDIGKYQGPEIVDRIIQKAERYNSIIRVEDNAAQAYIRQFTIGRDVSVPVQKHTTGKNKSDIHYGVQSIFVELKNGAWLIPNRNGVVHPNILRWINECTYYVPGQKRHTGDTLMAAWFAREQARAMGVKGHEGKGRSGRRPVQVDEFAAIRQLVAR